MTDADPFASHPRVPLGNWPTPVRRLERLSAELGVEVWAKVEDGSGTWSANKVRKLEYLLGAAQAHERSRIFTFGVASSTWCAAAAHYGASQAFEVHVALAGSIPGHLAAAYEAPGIHMTVLPTHASLPVTVAWRRAIAGRCAAFGPGGSGGVGDMGSTHAGMEVAAAVTEGRLPRPERVFVAAGTCGTAAGLAVGMTTGGVPAALCAVRVTPRPLGSATLLARRIRGLSDLVGFQPDTELAAAVDDGFHQPGYGRPSPASEDARAIAGRDDLDLDSAYGAKAFAALLDHARLGGRGPLLFVSTSPVGEPST